MLIAQRNGYRIMTPSVFRLVALETSLSLCNVVRHRPLNLLGEMKAEWQSSQSGSPGTISVGVHVSIIDQMNE